MYLQPQVVDILRWWQFRETEEYEKITYLWGVDVEIKYMYSKYQNIMFDVDVINLYTFIVKVLQYLLQLFFLYFL